MTAEQLRASLLQAAVQGKLVPQLSTDGNVKDLIKEIEKEKENIIRDKRIKKRKASSHIKKEGDSYYEVKGNTSICIDDELPFSLPENWTWVRFSHLVHYTMGKTPPRNDSEYWSNAEYHWISIADMVSNGITKTSKEKVNEFSYNNIFHQNITPAQTLIMSFKLTVGRVSILGINAFHNEAIISIFPYYDHNYTVRNYLFYILPLLSTNSNTKKLLKGIH